MNSPFYSKDDALSALLDVSSVAGLVEQALNSTDGEHVPFSSCYLEATMRTIRETLTSLHWYLDEHAEVKS